MTDQWTKICPCLQADAERTPGQFKMGFGGEGGEGSEEWGHSVVGEHEVHL